MNATELLIAWWLSLCVWREARGESAEGKALVAAVILNRSRDSLKRWPRTIQAVVRQPMQFSSFNDNDANSKLYPKESDVSWVESVEAAEKALTADPPLTKANHYHVWTGPSTVSPPWADQTKVTETVGAHRFYLL